jgi:phosphatidate cytidylyltransferase
MLKTRVFTAVVLVIGFLLALFLLPELWWSLLVLAAILLAAHEWSRLWAFTSPQEYAYLLSIAAFGALALSAVLPRLWMAPNYFYGCGLAFWFVAAPLWLRFGWKPASKWLGAIVGWLILLPFWFAMMDLHAFSPWRLLAAMVLVWVADIAAYFAGRAFGRRKLAPSISPGKTWEGVAGALAGVLVYVAVLIMIWERISETPGAADPYLWTLWIALAIVMTAISIVGDLFESAIKRRAGVKDSGVLLPGHGGLLDRIDALLPVLPLAALTFPSAVIS